jgi:flagellar biosynthesis/type III secretory pathway protein FliH
MLDESVKLAIKYCKENNILKKFFDEHSSEVFNMLLTEWNWDDALEVAREEGHEDGLEEGVEKSRQYFLELLNQDLTKEEIKQRLNQKEEVF